MEDIDECFESLEKSASLSTSVLCSADSLSGLTGESSSEPCGASDPRQCLILFKTGAAVPVCFLSQFSAACLSRLSFHLEASPFVLGLVYDSRILCCFKLVVSPLLFSF